MPRLSLRTVLRTALVLAALLWIPWVLAGAVNLDRLSWKIPAAEAFLPYAAAATAAVLIAAVLARARAAAVLALLGLVILLGPRIGRATADQQPSARGPVVTIATSNVYVGEGDPVALTRLVRSQGVDILAVEENTPQFDAAARRAGLRRLLPHGMSDPDARPGAAGLALWSRWPITRIEPAEGDHRSLGGTIKIPGAPAIHVRTVHPPPPFNAGNMPCWQRCTRALSGADQATGHAILAGDYNATLDHHPLRSLLNSGYRDAADQTGQAWRPTWTNGSWAHLTIDHILVTGEIGVLKVTTHDLSATDHDVVVTRLRLPR